MFTTNLKWYISTYMHLGGGGVHLADYSRHYTKNDTLQERSLPFQLDSTAFPFYDFSDESSHAKVLGKRGLNAHHFWRTLITTLESES